MKVLATAIRKGKDKKHIRIGKWKLTFIVHRWYDWVKENPKELSGKFLELIRALAIRLSTQSVYKKSVVFLYTSYR